MSETPRVIGRFAGFTVVAGSMIGVGIFLFPPAIAQETGSLLLFLLIWLFGGLFAFSGSVACGELGAMLPFAGGEYVFQREAYSDSVAFAAGWVLFVSIFGGSIAGMSVAVFQYQLSALINYDLMTAIGNTLQIPIAHLLAVILIFVITLVNNAGTRVATGMQIVFTLTPVILLLLLGGYAVFTAVPDLNQSLLPEKMKAFSLNSFITAFLFVNFAFSGWLNIIYVAGEVKQPGKNIPKAMFWAVAVVTFVYLLMNIAFVTTLGFDGLASLINVDAGTAMAGTLNKPVMAKLVLITITIAIITSINATVLTSSRVAYAMAKDGAFWRSAAKLNKRKVPGIALWSQAVFASALILTGSFYAIIEMASIAMFITGTLTVVSLFVLRKKYPDKTRPYKASWYPWLPALYPIFSILALVGAIKQSFLSEGEARFFPFIGVIVLVLAYFFHLTRKKMQTK